MCICILGKQVGNPIWHIFTFDTVAGSKTVKHFEHIKSQFKIHYLYGLCRDYRVLSLPRALFAVVYFIVLCVVQITDFNHCRYFFQALITNEEHKYPLIAYLLMINLRRNPNKTNKNNYTLKSLNNKITL